MLELTSLCWPRATIPSSPMAPLGCGALCSRGGATIMSTQAVVLRDLVEQADLKNFVFVDEKEDWRSYEGAVKSAIEKQMKFNIC